MRLEGKVEKVWGYELIWATNELYCGKQMVFTKAGNKFSLHYHMIKDESWIVTAGSFKLRWIDTKTAEHHYETLNTGDTWHNPPGMPHQVEALEDMSSIREVSTADSTEDNYRIEFGSSA